MSTIPTPEELERYREDIKRKNTALKDIVQDAKSRGVHPSIVRMIEGCYRAATDNSIALDLFKGASEEAIVAYEKSNGITIPAAYREFLKFSDGARVYSAVVDFLSISKENPLSRSLFSENYETLKDEYEGFTDNYLVIGGGDMGNIICADLNTGEIVGWDPEGGLEDVHLGNDFFDYLEEEVIDYLEWEMKNNEQT